MRFQITLMGDRGDDKDGDAVVIKAVKRFLEEMAISGHPVATGSVRFDKGGEFHVTDIASGDWEKHASGRHESNKGYNSDYVA